MPTGLKRLITPSDSEAVRLQKLTEAVAPNLPADIQRQVQAVRADDAASSEDKWRRAITESVVGLQADSGFGAAGGAQYIHTQDMPASVWLIEHKLGGYPSVTVVDSGNNVGFGAVRYLDTLRLEVSFSAGFSGKAYLTL